MFHGRLMQRGSQTVLGNTANEREVFLTIECMSYKLQDVKQTISLEVQKMPWGHHHGKIMPMRIKLMGQQRGKRKDCHLNITVKACTGQKGVLSSVSRLILWVLALVSATLVT